MAKEIYRDYTDLNLNFLVYSSPDEERFIAICQEHSSLRVKGLTVEVIKSKMRDMVIKHLGNTQIFRSCFYTRDNTIRFNAKIKQV